MDPYPARFYAPLVDEPFTTEMAATLPYAARTYSLSQPLPRLLLLLLTLYLFCAISLFFTVASHAAPLGSSTSCIETTAIAAR